MLAMPQLRIAPEVQRDIDEIYVWGILRFGVPQADKYMQELADLLGAVERNPLMARERDDVRPPVRLLPFHSHYVFYGVANGDGTVVRILHHSSDWLNAL